MNNTQNDQLIAITTAFNNALNAIVNPISIPQPTVQLEMGDFFLEEKRGTKKKYNLTEANAIEGYKGFHFEKATKELRCRSTVFQPGKILSVVGDVALCSNGFHFCKELHQVDNHYNLNTEEYVFYKVRGWGQIHEETGDKIAAEFIQVGEKVTVAELFEAKLAEHMKIVGKLIDLNPNLVISGSLALILLGIIPHRVINDFDFTLPFYAPIGDDSELIQKFGDSGNECIQVEVGYDKDERGNTMTEKIDLFVNPTTPFSIVNFKGRDFRVSEAKIIIDAKFRYFMNGKMKHAKDLKTILENYDGKTGKAIRSFARFASTTSTKKTRNSDWLVEFEDGADDELCDEIAF